MMDCVRENVLGCFVCEGLIARKPFGMSKTDLPSILDVHDDIVKTILEVSMANKTGFGGIICAIKPMLELSNAYLRL